MSRSLLLPVAALGLLLGQAAHAQALNGATQSPPAPNAQQGAPQPLNSVPSGSLTGATPAPGAALGGTSTPASSPVNSLHPLRQPRHTTHHTTTRHRSTHRAAAQ